MTSNILHALRRPQAVTGRSEAGNGPEDSIEFMTMKPRQLHGTPNRNLAEFKDRLKVAGALRLLAMSGIEI